MANLRFISISCRATEDFTGADEAMIRVNGVTRWRGSLNDGQSASLNSVPIIGFTSTAKIELFDEDTGGADNNDLLGVHDAKSTEAGQGEKFPVFNKDGADYTIVYRVDG